MQDLTTAELLSINGGVTIGEVWDGIKEFFGGLLNGFIDGLRRR
ncbi:hypothetical protein [Aureibacter tunicatorum]|uniref:Uncharacterized protein n=1 Tax=Aureibacter tunicatorum TaxID=866807 RepID=A0AAE3XQ97_9BACT|nr:hypothetical protein [Aureibacter tunicatorum]MDR6240738.1 hypothetical protein [Aureibacter tunicatorum]BDD06929.1 hypothetical protein AUTU_44120 [Aureibacter tunicatorum]